MLGHLRAVDVHVVWVLFTLAQLCPILKKEVNVNKFDKTMQKAKHDQFVTNLAVDVIIVTFVLALIARNRAANQHPVA